MALLQEIQVPLLAVNDTTLTVVEIPFSNGAKVKKGELVMVFETSKTTYDVEASEDGFIQYLCEADRDYEVNAVVARIYSELAEAQAAPVRPAGAPLAAGASILAATPALTTNGHAVARGSGNPPPMSSPADLPYWEGETLFSREAERLIESGGIDKSVFKGKDFVAAADVLHVLRPAPERASAPGSASATAPVTASAPATSSSRSSRPPSAQPVDPAKAILEKMSSAKRREIEYLSEVQGAGLSSTIHTFVSTEGIFIHINPALKYLKDSLLPVIVYESARLLADYPLLNAWYTGEGVARYREIAPGFAIDIDKGLKVLKIGRAAEKSIGEIEKDILYLSGSYLDDTLKLEDLTEITFTITDLSAEGVAFFHPLINKMNSSILGVSAIDEKLQRCALSLAFDHRVTEGRLAARFLKDLKDRLESYRPADFAAYKDIACFKCYKTLKEDLGGIGFTRCITPEGKEGYVCQACLKGF
jgi:pyruvate dehydrogenase E2 component (dihydrolipoamide acetyltransferase)